MKRIVFVLMAVAAIVLTGCEKNHINDVDSNPPENGNRDRYYTCTCGNRYNFRLTNLIQRPNASLSNYKVYASGEGEGSQLYLAQDGYPFVAYKEGVNDEAYFFWRCECGRYHKVKLSYLTHTEIPAGQQPDEWNKFNYLWE